MSSIRRALNGDVLVHHLTQDERTLDADLLARHGRTGRTIVKEGPLRLTIIGVAAAGQIPAHSTEAHVTIQVLDGSVTFGAQGSEYSLQTGDVLIIAPGVEHEARSATGATLLLTAVYLGPQRDDAAED
jgi:quercetin dioxygenase-like cupin family protein